MKRSFLTPLLCALVGGGVVVAVVAAAGDLEGSSTRTVVEQTPASPVASATPTQEQSAGLTYHEIYERTAPGVVFVTSTVVERNDSPFFFGETTQGEDTGSGIEVDSKGDILTNYHVVENAVKVTVGLDNSKTVEAKVIGKDPSEDLAVLRIPTEGVTLHPLTLGDSSNVEVGEPVVAIGNPFNLQRTLTTGVVSALQRQLEAPNGFQIDNVIQTDAPINPGNSGGPLLNVRGEVIGINSQIETGSSTSDGNIGIGFAVPINTAKSKLPQLEEGKSLRGAYLGVFATSLTPALAQALNISVKEGALIQEVVKGTPAEKAGIKGGALTAEFEGQEIHIGGDIIIEVNGKQIKSDEGLTSAIEAEQPGDTVTIKLEEAAGNGQYKEKTVKAKLGARPNQSVKTTTPEEGSEREPESLFP